MFYKNARIFTSDFQFVNGSFEVTEDGFFGAILPGQAAEDAIDLQGATVIPGLVDVHNHGNSGADFSDGDYDGLCRMAAYLAANGITSFAPASMTLPYDILEKAFATAKQLADTQPAGCARLMGIQMEGPYFSEKKKGAQNGEYLKTPDYEGFKKLYDGCGGLIRIADVAPELPGAEEFIAQARKLCTVSVAHTDSDYDHAQAAFAAGATHLTHLYNAMPGIHHRNPGVIPAAVENEHVRAELICDGMHVHPASVRLAFSMFGGARMILVSDALRCCGMPDGEYELGGQLVFLSGGVARLADGTLAGSSTNLYDCMRKAMVFGIPEADAVRAASYNPACALGAQDKIGSIATGRLADFIVCSPDYAEKQVYMSGKKLTIPSN
jgi:N-acetylglucosamine-6-phosphate deacetylase